MNHSFPLDILILAVFAAVLFFRLRKVLGEKQEGEPPSIDPALLLKARQLAGKANDDAQAPADKNTPPQIAVNWAQAMPNYQWVANATTHNRLLPLAAVDPSFNPSGFLQGARRAYELVVVAFARGDVDTLQALLAPSLYDAFKDDIQQRQKDGQQRELLLHTMRSALISDASLTGTMAYVTVDFVTEQSITLRDRNGQVVDGLDGSKHVLHERWVFSNDLKDDETLWRLVETDAIDD
ncbi:MAG TPA: Tim44/TimA family putative adaptor protein [Alphaproteobacteria bacterium]